MDMVKQTLKFEVELTEEQDVDFRLFCRRFKDYEILRINQSNWGEPDSLFWGIMNYTRYIGLANKPLNNINEDTKKAEDENGTEMGSNALKEILPFFSRMKCIKKKNGGVFNCELKSGLWLIISPKVEPV